MQNKELERVKAKIRALTEKTTDRGCTEAETMAALKKVGQLLEQYNLSMSEIELTEEPCIKKEYISIHRNRGALASCVVRLSQFCDLKVWTEKTYFRGTGLKYVFFGMESDVEMAIYLSGLIERAVEAEGYRFKNTKEYRLARSKKAATTSFKHGMGIRLSNRFEEMISERDLERTKRASANNTTFASNSRSLTVIKQDIVGEEFKNLGMKLRYTYSGRRTTDYNSYNAGKAAGDRVNLSRPVGSSGGYGYTMIGK